MKEGSRASHRPQRHLALLITLLVLFVAAPLIVKLRFGLAFLGVVGVAVLVSGTYAARTKPALFHLTIALSVVSLITSALVILIKSEWMVLVSHVCNILLLIVFTVGILSSVLAPGSVTADRIYASICVYLLIGYTFTFVFAVVEQLQPGSFTGLSSEVRVDYIERVLQMRHFSFVTMTTVGYGDITPKAPFARSLADLEAISGQLYLAVLVARLVGLHIAQASRD